MQLSDIRTEVLAHGFGSQQFPTSRLNQFINEAYGIVCRRVNYFVDDATQDFATVSGTSTYPWPTDVGRLRSLRDKDRTLDLQAVGLDDIDQASVSNGAPRFYALAGQTVLLYPVPDGVYNLEYRYWKLPASLVADGDVPTLPAAWHSLLVFYALKRCYAGDDDMTQAQYWEQEFNTMLSQFSGDVKFPSDDMPHQLRGMWDDDSPLQRVGWS